MVNHFLNVVNACMVFFISCMRLFRSLFVTSQFWAEALTFQFLEFVNMCCHFFEVFKISEVMVLLVVRDVIILKLVFAFVFPFLYKLISLLCFVT